jgi:ketosteroid isomerase-like protein
MRTEIMPDSERPAMTAEQMRRAITDVFNAYATDNRDLVEKWLSEDFTFTSPYDDAIDRQTYFQRCWPNHNTTAKMKVERIFIDGNAAYVTYLCTSTDGHEFRNTEYFVFQGGLIASVVVYFGPEYRDGRMIEKGMPEAHQLPQDSTASIPPIGA